MPSDPAKLMQRLSSLGRTVDGVNAPPTESQLEYHLKLRDEFAQAMMDVNGHLREAVPRLNDVFERYQVPQVLIPDLVVLTGDRSM